MSRRSFPIFAPVLLIGLVLAAQDPNSPDAGDRRRAARDLVRSGADGIPKLVPLLSDPDLAVRIEAVKALVEVDTLHSLDPLIGATRDKDPEIQIRATDGLVNFYLPGYVRSGLSSTLRRAGDRVISRFTDLNEQIVDLYVEVRPEVIEALGLMARSGSSMESRANAARALGILRGRAAVPDLLEAVRSKDSQLMYECLVAFQKIRDRSAGPRLTSLVRDLDRRVQLAAIQAAGLLYNLEALPSLRELMRRSVDKQVLRAALASIAMLSDPASHDLLFTYLPDRDAELRESAAEGLGRLKNPADLPLLEKAFDREGDASARVSLAFALVMHGRRELSEFSPLQYLVNTLNSATRAGEARPLLTEAARDPQVRRTLAATLKDATKAEKKELAWVLADGGGEEDIPVLEALSRDADAGVADEVIRALRTIKARLR
jgi:HEAT repeat protein